MQDLTGSSRRRFAAAAAAISLLLALFGVAPAMGGGASPTSFPSAVTDKVSGVVKDVLEIAKPGPVDVILVYNNTPGLIDRLKIQLAGGEVTKTYGAVPAVAARMSVLGLLTVIPDSKVAWVSLDSKITSSAVAKGLVVPKPVPMPRPPIRYTGAGIGVAVLDSGVALHSDLSARVSAYVDVTGGPAGPNDPWGHGTHVAGIIAASGDASRGAFRGVAPGANIVSVRVLGANGEGKVSDVLAGIDWVLANRTRYNIRVVNFSLGHPVFEPSALDPLVRAVETLWNSGIVVVCSAGNMGKYGNFTITSPANSSRVISVGSLTDWGSTASDDDIVSTYSSHGPTHIDHFAKPDLLALGNKVVSLRAPGSSLDAGHPDWRVQATGSSTVDYFRLSGTSMAAPAVASAAAILLEKDPSLNPDTVKARLMRSATKRPGVDPYARGTGVMDIGAALTETGRTLYAGSPIVTRDPYEPILFPKEAGSLWGDTSLWSDFALWGDTALWSDFALWGDTALWSDFTTWGDTSLWSDTALWSDSTPSPD